MSPRVLELEVTMSLRTQLHLQFETNPISIVSTVADMAMAYRIAPNLLIKLELIVTGLRSLIAGAIIVHKLDLDPIVVRLMDADRHNKLDVDQMDLLDAVELMRWINEELAPPIAVCYRLL